MKRLWSDYGNKSGTEWLKREDRGVKRVGDMVKYGNEINISEKMIKHIVKLSPYFPFNPFLLFK